MDKGREKFQVWVFVARMCAIDDEDDMRRLDSRSTSHLDNQYVSYEALGFKVVGIGNLRVW